MAQARLSDVGFWGVKQTLGQAPETTRMTQGRLRELRSGIAGQVLALVELEPRHKRDAAYHEGRAQHAPAAQRMNGHAEPAEMIDRK